MVIKQVHEIKKSTGEQLVSIGKQIEGYQSEIEKCKHERIANLKVGDGARAIELQREIDTLQQFIDAFDSDIDKVMDERSSIDALIQNEISSYLQERKEKYEQYKTKASKLKSLRNELLDGLEEMYETYEKINSINNKLEYLFKEMSEEGKAKVKKSELGGYSPYTTTPIMRELLIPNVKGVR